MKYFLVLFLFIALNNNVFCQKDSLRFNSVFIELGGVSGYISINYDCNIPIKDRIGLNIGFGYSPLVININENYLNIKEFEYSPRFPIQIKMYYQLKKHTFDFGVAITPYISQVIQYSAYNKGIDIFGQIGYKYSIINDLCYVGAAFCPIISHNREFLFFPWGALRIGYKFK